MYSGESRQGGISCKSNPPVANGAAAWLSLHLDRIRDPMGRVAKGLTGNRIADSQRDIQLTTVIVRVIGSAHRLAEVRRPLKKGLVERMNRVPRESTPTASVMTNIPGSKLILPS